MNNCSLDSLDSEMFVNFQFLFELNPVYLAIAGARDAILTGVFPNVKYMIVLAVVAVILLVIGMYIFYKYQDKFILFL